MPEEGGTSAARPGGTGVPAPAHAVLQLPDFAVQAAWRARGAEAEAPLGRRPPAVVCAARGRRALVVEADAAARAAGVVPGLTVSAAEARCAGLLVLLRDPAAEEAGTALLLAEAATLGARVEATAPGVATVDLAGTPPGGRRAAALAAVARLRAAGWRSRGGLGANPARALLAAGACGEEEAVADDTAERIGALPVAALRPPASLAERLESWGVRTVAALAALPRDGVASRLGAEGLALQELARGGGERPVDAVVLPEDPVGEVAFDPPVETLPPLALAARKLLAGHLRRVRATGEGIAALRLRVVFEDGSAHEAELRPPEPTAEAGALGRLVEAHLGGVRAAARAVAVTLGAKVSPTARRQGDLFEAGLADPARFAATVAELSGLVGAEAVGEPEAVDTHRPDAFRMGVAGGGTAPWVEEEAAPIHPVLGPALRRRRPPTRVRVSLAPGGAPVTVEIDGEALEVVGRSGPWRLSGDWWDEASWEREEWDVETRPPGLWRLARTPRGWFLEGAYD